MTELNSSELGTKEYWESAYKEELNVFADCGDVGEVWFGEASERRMVKWLANCNDIDKKNCSVLDVGCGNGHLSIQLAKAGFGNVLGIDYVQEAIALAEKVANAEIEDPEIRKRLRFETCDFLSESLCLSPATFEIIVDKGTYDAISLCPDGALQKRQAYLKQLSRLLKIGVSFFVITSCNWTKSELETQFMEHGFSLLEIIPTPQMSFGGSTGSNVTSLVFVRK